MKAGTLVTDEATGKNNETAKNNETGKTNETGKDSGTGNSSRTMNTDRSDERVRKWRARRDRRKRATLVPERMVNAKPEVVFPLLCPTREYDWIEDWDCQLLHSKSGYAEHNVVFRTCIMGVEETWICTHYEPCREIHYIRMAPGLTIKLEISLLDEGHGKTLIRWSLTASGLSEEMNDAVTDLEEGGTRIHRLEHLLDDLEHYLEKGEMRRA